MSPDRPNQTDATTAGAASEPGKPSPASIPLARMPARSEGRVVAFRGGRGFRSHVAAMGLQVGHRLRVMRGCGGLFGSALVAVGETRLVIGHGMARKILVEPDET